MAVQTSYSKNPAVGQEGQLADTHQVQDIISRQVNNAALHPGRAMLRGSSDDDESGRLIMAPVSSPDVDAWMTTTSSPSSETTYSGSSDLDGTLGDAEHAYGWYVDLIVDSHADWDDTNATLKYKRASDGQIIEETLDIPDGGNTTLTSTYRACKVVSLTIPAQSGTSGSFTLGISGTARLNRSWIQGLPVLRTMRESPEYAVDEEAPVLRRGRMYVESEVAVSEGDRVWVRHTAPGAETIGHYRNDSDSDNAVPFPARFAEDTTGSGLAKIELDVPGFVEDPA